MADVVLVYSLDRLSRNTENTLALLKEFKRAGAELQSTTSPIVDTPVGKMTLTMLSAFAEFEETQIRLREADVQAGSRQTWAGTGQQLLFLRLRLRRRQADSQRGRSPLVSSHV
jgi:DNA invertase Pin-like site-specific DNA recombinase